MATPFLTKRWLINYLLLILVVLFTVIGNRYNVETGYKPENTVSSIKPQDIDTVSIQTADFNINLSKSVSQWFIESPIAWPANNISVERLISIVNSTTDSRLPSKDIDLSSLGLQFPKAILTLNQTQFLFGITNNIGERRYLMSESIVFLLPDNHFPLLNQGLAGLLDRRLLPRSISLQGLKFAAFDLTSSATGEWQDANSEIDSDLLNRLVGNWQTLEAGRLKRYDSQKLPLQKITATINQTTSIEFFLMAIEPEIIISRPDLGYQYHFDSSFYYELLAIKQNQNDVN